MKKRLTILTIFMTCLILSLGGTAFAFSKIVAFGDSLTDNGIKPPVDNYGLNVWTNGKVWVEYVADEMGAQLDDRALGGSETGGPNGLVSQVSQFASEGQDPTDVLFIIWSGGNDFLNMTDPNQAPYVIGNAVNNIAQAVYILYTVGAKDILIMNLPNLGSIPLNNGTPDQAAGAAFLSRTFNEYLLNAMCSYVNGLPGVNFYWVDTYQLINFIIADPIDFGFTNVTDSAGGSLEDPNIPAGFAFWNDVHPSTAAHQIIAAAACGQVYHHNLSSTMKDLLRKLNALRPRQPLEYDCDLLVPVAP